MQYWCFPNIGILVNRSLGAKIQWSFHWGMFWQCFGDLENELMFGCFFFHRRKRKYSIAVLQYYRSLCYVWSSCVVIKLLYPSSPKKTFYLVKLTQMWAGEPNLFLWHIWPLFPKNSGKITVIITFRVTNQSFYGVGGFTSVVQ